MSDYHPLPDFLDLVVPLKILELQLTNWQPSDQELEQAREFADVLGSQGDILLYRSKKKGETARVFSQMARAIAVGAFLPGGITVFGNHYITSSTEKSCLNSARNQ